MVGRLLVPQVTSDFLLPKLVVDGLSPHQVLFYALRPRTFRVIKSYMPEGLELRSGLNCEDIFKSDSSVERVFQ